MGAIVGAMTVFIVLGFLFWVFCTAGQVIDSVGRTGKAIGKWNDEMLKDKK